LIMRLGTRDLASMNRDLEIASATRLSSPGMWRTFKSMEDMRIMLYVWSALREL
jgi:hypothetical protein